MTFSPARPAVPPVSAARPSSPAMSGNLARLQPVRLGQSLSQAPDDIGAYLPDPNEAAVLLPAAARTGAAMNRRVLLPPAESRPFPFPQVNHVMHLRPSVADTTRDSRECVA